MILSSTSRASVPAQPVIPNLLLVTVLTLILTLRHVAAGRTLRQGVGDGRGRQSTTRSTHPKLKS